MPSEFDVQRYLAAKRTVDDRALSPRVLDRVAESLSAVDGPRVLDFGAGLGMMLNRLFDRAVLPDGTRYTAVEIDGSIVSAARDRLRTTGSTGSGAIDVTDDGYVYRDGGRRVTVEYHTANGYPFLASTAGEWDLIIGQAFLEEPDVSTALGRLAHGLAPGGLCYLPTVFDGGTIFAPPMATDIDDTIERLYHDHLDRSGSTGTPAGNSRAGRETIAAVPDLGGRVIAAAGADWVVYPSDGEYDADEAYVLRHLVEAIRRSLDGHPTLDPDRLAAWVECRREQIDAGTLVFIAHQLDVAVRFPD